MHDLFEAVRQEILGLAPEVREEFTRHYVAYKTNTNFTDVVPQKRRLLLTLNTRFDEITDPRGLAADITNLGLWGNGDVQLEVDNARQIALRDGARATGLRGQADGRRQGERRPISPRLRLNQFVSSSCAMVGTSHECRSGRCRVTLSPTGSR